MYYNFIKITLPMMLTVFLVGCGGSDDNTVPPEEINYPDAVSNEGQAVSLLGYYGDDVYLGDQKIVGKWQGFYIPEGGEALLSGIADMDYTFNNDGTGYYSLHENLTGTRSSFKYGLQGSWQMVLSRIGTTDNPLMPLIIFNVNGYKDGCFKIKHTDPYGDNYQPFYLCKVE